MKTLLSTPAKLSVRCTLVAKLTGNDSNSNKMFGTTDTNPPTTLTTLF
jgi:hypothetical protein